MFKECIMNKLSNEEITSLMSAGNEVSAFDEICKAVSRSIVNGENGIGLPYWAENEPMLVKRFTYLMAIHDVGTTSVSKAYSRFTLNMDNYDKDKLYNYRISYLLDKSLLRLDEKEYPNNLVRRNGKLYNDGVARPGSYLASKRPFMLDTEMLVKYKRPIKMNLIKSIEKGVALGRIDSKIFKDNASYYDIVSKSLDYYISCSTRLYNSEVNWQDQRSRAIKKVLKRIGNYISSKDFRAMLVIPKEYSIAVRPTDTVKLNDIYYHIAELTGRKCIGGTEADKIQAGKDAYNEKWLPKLDLSTHHGRKGLHELIWLERIYNKLDKVFSNKIIPTRWDILLEVDHSMCLGQICGAITNDKRILESTGVIGDTLNDPWYMQGVRRDSAKAYGTPNLYGSSASIISLIKKKGFTYLQELLADNPGASDKLKAEAIKNDKAEVKAIRKAFTEGRFGVLSKFKEMLIKNYSNFEPIIDIDNGIFKHKVHISKFKVAGYDTVVTEAYDTDSRKFKYSFTKKPKYIPDYAKMRTFWATGLIHSLDADLVDYNLNKHPSYYALDLYDALLCLPGNAVEFRESAAKRLKYYNTHRVSIVQSYMKSIGANTIKGTIDYLNLCNMVHEADDVEFKRTLMK